MSNRKSSRLHTMVAIACLALSIPFISAAQLTIALFLIVFGIGMFLAGRYWR